MIFLKIINFHITAGQSYYVDTSPSIQDELSLCENAQNKCKCNQKGNERLRKDFTSDQKEALEGEFTNEHYPDFSTRERIAGQIGSTEKRIQVKIFSRYHVDREYFSGRWARFNEKKNFAGHIKSKKILCGP